MNYLVSDIVRDARVALDQNNSSAQLTALGDVDTLTLNEIVESKVEEAARLVESEAPYYMLDGGEQLGGAVVWKGQPGYGSGYIMLPQDFLRLLTFRMSDWERTVTEPINTDSPQYALQSSRYGGVRGNPERPVVALVPDGGGMRLEFYSCNAGPGVVVHEARYLPLPIIVSGRFSVCDKLYKAVVYRVASLTAQSQGDANLAAMLLATSNTLADIEG